MSTTFILMEYADGCSWGFDDCGQTSNTPTTGEFLQLAAGRNHSLGLKTDRSIVCWGLGNGRPVTGKYNMVTSGAWHSLAISSEGSIVGWGFDRQGQGEYALVFPTAYNLTTNTVSQYRRGRLESGAVRPPRLPRRYCDV